MATVTWTDDEIVVRLTNSEKLASLHGDIHVPVAAVRKVGVEPRPLAAVRGLRAPGLAIPGRTKIGTWRRYRHRGFVVARRDMPAVRVRLAGAAYDDLIVSTANAEAVAAALAASTTAASVTQP